MKRLGILLAVLLVGCGVDYDLSSMTILVNAPLDMPRRQLALDVLEASVEQLGGRMATSGAGQIVKVRAVESCPEGWGGDVSWDAPDTVKLCPSLLVGPEASMRWVVSHELGHVLGVHRHLDCSTGATMVPEEKCFKSPSNGLPYSSADVAAICEVTKCGPAARF